MPLNDRKHIPFRECKILKLFVCHLQKKGGIYKALRNSTNHTEALSMNLLVLQRGIYYSHLSSVSM